MTWVRACADSSCIEVAWVRACSESSCVEVAEFPSGSVQIRLTGSPDYRLFPSMAEWVAFRDGVKAGQFDQLRSVSDTDDG